MKKCTVIGFTEVNAPSDEHAIVPYNVLLLRSDSGQLLFKKSFERYAIGDILHLDTSEHGELIGIIGSGTMGIGLAAVFARAGFRVVIKTRDLRKRDSILHSLHEELAKSMLSYDVTKAIKNVIVTDNYATLAEAKLIIESVIENTEIKREVFRQISELCADSILASNTSSIPIAEIAAVAKNPNRIIGLHFFNPPTKIKLLEVIPHANTSQDVIQYSLKLAEKIGKVPIISKDRPGFIVNRLLMLFLNEAVKELEEGVASPEAIDAAIKLGLNHPMGPFKLIDLIGVDVFVEIMDNIYERTKDPKFLVSPLARKMLQEGKLGLKVGGGFLSR